MSDEIPIFIGGAGRSGTTLLVDMLGLHPRLSPIYETDFVLEVGSVLFGRKRSPPIRARREIHQIMDRWTAPLPKRPDNKRNHEIYVHGPHYVLFDRPFAMQRTAAFIESLESGKIAQAFRQFVRDLFAEHCRRDGKPRWINKTPAYVMALPLLRSIFPRLRFLHCVRDGRDVACSVVTRPWGPATREDSAEWWMQNVRRGMDFTRQHPEQSLEIRYEDLVKSPQKSLTCILDWLGENSDPGRILDHYATNREVRLDVSRIGIWKKAFTAQQRQHFQSIAGDILDHFGYTD